MPGGSYDWVIVNGTAKMEKMSASAVKCANLVLIPIQSYPLDIWACDFLVDMIGTALVPRNLAIGVDVEAGVPVVVGYGVIEYLQLDWWRYSMGCHAYDANCICRHH